MRKTLPSALSAILLLAGCTVAPKPLTTGQINAFSQDKLGRITENQEVLDGPVSLYEAVARALKYNLDRRVELMEISLRTKQLNLAHYSMLPSIVANSGYVKRNNFSGGRSVTLLGDRNLGDQSLRASTSTEREIKTADLKLSWHILDFGLSYIRAKQAADRALIAEENKRKVVNRIASNVRSAYWRVVSAQRLVRQLRGLSSRVNRARSNARRLSATSDTSPLTALTYERELAEIQREIQSLLADLAVAKNQLAALMNVRPGKNFSVIIPRHMRTPRRLPVSASEMEHLAVKNRPELREVAYQARINLAEARAAILEILPGVSADVAPNWNSNEFLFNQHWVTWGAKASLNLLKVFSYPARRDQIEAQGDLIDARALAVTMAVLTQVHVARVRLTHARRKFAAALNFHRIQLRILKQINHALAAGKVSEQTAIREEMNSLVSRVKLDLAFVEVENSFANAYASVGINPYGNIDVDAASVPELKRHLTRRWRALGDRYVAR